MTPDQLRELADALETTGRPGGICQRAANYLRECANAEPVGFEFYNRATGHAVIDYGRYTRLRLLGDGYETIPLYAHPTPQPERQPASEPRKPFLCAVCGERQPYMFDHRYKSICERCRTTRERDRHRAKVAQRRAA